MAFAKGRESVSEGSIKRYIGVAPFTVIAVNPTKKEMEEIYGTTLEKEPEYISEKDGVKTVRLDFILKSDAEKCGFELLTKLAFFIRNEKRANKDNTKLQIIDKYGATAWVTNEEYKEKAIPMYANGPARIDKDYRAIYGGEENLTNFIIAYLNIPSLWKWKEGQIVGKIDDPSEAEARIDNIEKLFNGDFSEMKEILTLQPENRVKVMLGIKTDEAGKIYQATFNEYVMRSGTKDYAKLAKTLEERKSLGAYPTTVFEVADAHEFNIVPTNLDRPKEIENPFGEGKTDDGLPF